jgi:hypothetical protein
MIRPLQLDPRVTLLTVPTVAAAIGRDNEGVAALCESGWLLHTFDISAGYGARRALRIFRGSVIAFQLGERDHSTTAEAIAQIIGEGTRRLRAGELVLSWSITRPHIFDLLRAGALTGRTEDHTTWIDRPSAVEFLTARASGNLAPLTAHRSLPTGHSPHCRESERGRH